MKVHFGEAGIPGEELVIADFRALAGRDRFGEHEVVDDAQAADAILFVQCHMADRDWRNHAIRRSDAFRRFRDRCFVVDERDLVWCSVPGLYTSMPASTFRRPYQRARGYKVVTPPQDVVGAERAAGIDRDLLLSFMGSATHPCREPIFEIDDPRAVVERVTGFVFYRDDSEDFEARRMRFATTLLRSHFVLCPRGRGTSSIRFHETLAAGRVPVVICDDWVVPYELDLADCTVRWPEGSVDGLLDHLQSRVGEAAEMGAAARRTHDEWFAEDVAFHRMVESLASLMADQPWSHFRRWGYPDHLLATRLISGGGRRAARLAREGAGRIRARVAPR